MQVTVNPEGKEGNRKKRGKQAKRVAGTNHNNCIT